MMLQGCVCHIPMPQIIGPDASALRATGAAQDIVTQPGQPRQHGAMTAGAVDPSDFHEVGPMG